MKQGGELGNGAAVWQAVVKKYESNTDDACRACDEELTTYKMQQGEDRDVFFLNTEDLQMPLTDMEEVGFRLEIRGYHYTGDHQRMATYDNVVHHTSFRVRDFGLEKVKIPRERCRK